MPKWVEYSPKARTDAFEAALQIGEDNPDAAMRFLDALEATVELLAEMPDLGRLREFESPKLAGMRSFLVSGFESYLVFYRAQEDHIEIARILHGARDLGPTLEE